MSNTVPDPGDILHQIAWSIRNSQDLPEILSRSVEGIQEFLKVDRVKLYQFESDGSGVVVAEARLGDRLPPLVGLRFPAEDIPPTARQTFARIRQCAIRDLASPYKTLFPLDPKLPPYQEAVSECHRDYLKAMGVQATLTLPVFERNGLWGLVSIHHSQPRHFSDYEQQILQLAIDQIAIAITQSRLLETARERQRHEKALERVTELLDDRHSWSSIQQEVLEEAVSALDASGGRLYLCSQPEIEGVDLAVRGDGAAVQHLEEHPQWQAGFVGYNPLSLDSSPHPEPISLDARAWTENPALQFLADLLTPTPVRSLLVIPLQYHRQCVGYLTLFRRGYNKSVWWAGKTNSDERQRRPRASFEAWRESHRDQTHPWTESQRKLAHQLGIHLYIAVVQHRVSAMLRYQVSHDPLTQLPNRLLFDEQLSLALVEARQQQTSMAVGFLDIDRFKAVNDSFGHHVGDRLLKTMTQRVLGCLQEGDCLARWGGDELVFLLGSQSCRNGVMAVAKDILTELRRPFECEGREFSISASLGLALAPQHGRDNSSLLRYAETALDWAKQQGRNTISLYNPDMLSSRADSLALELDLEQAILNQEFCLHYQPQIDLASGKIVAVEALIRWQHPERGRVPPDRFIPIAEETGAIQAIGEWVLRTACRQHRDWIKMGFKPLKMAVNLSARQFQQANLLATIVEILEESQMKASYLELEITETTAVKDVELSISVLHRLREMGVQIAMDDFGTGYSCLSFIKQFPLDTLKIDRSFVRDLTRDSSDAAIAKTIVALGQGLNLIVLAEGVETSEQAEFLKSIHCDLAQGYLFSRPVPGTEIPDLLRQWAVFQGIEKVTVLSTRRPHYGSQSSLPETAERRAFLQRRIRDLEQANAGLRCDRDELQQSLRRLNHYLHWEEHLTNLSRAILGKQPLVVVFQQAVVGIRRELGLLSVVAYRYDAHGNTIPIAEDRGSHHHRPAAAPDLYSLVSKPSPDVLALCNLDYVHLSADDAVVLAEQRVKACVLVPIYQQGSIWGAIVLHQAAVARNWQPKELAWLEKVANLLLLMELPCQTPVKGVFSCDPLTGLPDAASFESRLRYEWGRLIDTQWPLTVILADVDGFGEYCQRHGQETGDRALKTLAEAWRDSLTRRGACLVRWQGDQFFVLLPHLDTTQGRATAELLRQQARRFISSQLTPTSLTVSFGVASDLPNPNLKPESLLETAQIAVRGAKGAGGDRVVIAPDIHVDSPNQDWSLLSDLQTGDSHE
ncbi:EAL domain-containing protein [Geitlerinema sp. P-1104]|uniref:EAL domain-containing protein n=1 Tax=Geitlerinema sp. P-1104 TaxID=2546230 RepID=UPI0014778195|nr:EAL domain-containing protein [Geitlerinema sp. P-1104]NMG57663.1 EAL domain-containing protein [Geitlerinema sp. P-1104]